MSDTARRNEGSEAPTLDFATLAGMVKSCPFHEWLGVELLSLDQTGVIIRMPWRAEVISEPDRGYAHGGVLASLIDLVADYAVAARLGRGALVARAAVIKLGGTLATAEARIFDGRDELIASGRALFFTRFGARYEGAESLTALDHILWAAPDLGAGEKVI
jgi:acyl-coenzyme A thioesterase PaaI-like protein